jgi:hypothetical protein
VGARGRRATDERSRGDEEEEEEEEKFGWWAPAFR